MASLSLRCSAHAAQSIKLGFHQNTTWLADYDSDSASPNHLHLLRNLHATSIFRFKNAAKLLIRRRLPLVQASNKPSEEPIEKTETSSSGDTSSVQGPPFLTILAGIVVFALLLWLVGSIVWWLIGLFSFSK